MRVRLAIVIACVVVLVGAAQSVLAQPEPPLICCTKIGDCEGLSCCEWDLVADLPCSEQEGGYCQPLCIRPSEAR